MAGQMGTNVTADGSAEYEFLSKILQMMEDSYLKRDLTKKGLLMRRLAEHLGMGGEAAYKLVPRKYAEDIENKLLEENVPYAILYDDKGNAGFVVRSCDREKFVEIQESVFMLSTEYYGQCTTKKLCEMAEKDGGNVLFELKFNTKEDLAIAQSKLYGSGVVCSVENDDGGGRAYISSAYIFKQEGEDLATFELEWAATQSMGDEMFCTSDTSKDNAIVSLRTQQAEYDMEQIDEFVSNAKEGKDSLIVDAFGTSEFALEISNHQVSILKNEKEGWTASKSIPLSEMALDTPEGEKQFRALISKVTHDINNMATINAENKREFLGVTPQAAREAAKKMGKLRPTAAASLHGKDLVVKTESDKELRPLLKTVEHIARERAKATPGFELLSAQKKHDTLRSIICDMLKAQDLPQIVSWVADESKGITSEEKKEWLENIASHLENTHEKGAHEVEVSSVNARQLRKQIEEAEKAEKTAEKGSEKEGKRQEHENEKGE